MRLEHEDTHWLKEEIRSTLSKHLDPAQYRFFFFGSRVRGDNFPRADIDLGIIGETVIPLETRATLREELEQIPILYKIDLVDFSETSEKFREEALKNTEPI